MSIKDIVFKKNSNARPNFLLLATIFLGISHAVYAQAPTATTDPASEIGLTFTTVNGTVNANDSQTTVTFEYGTDTNYGGHFVADQSPVTGSVNTAVSATLYELESNTTYHYRVVAVNADGATNGQDMTFKTLERPPASETTTASAIVADGATLNGMVFGRGYDTDVTFEFGEDTNYGRSVTAEQSPLLNPLNTINFPVSRTITGLSNNTTYHYRVVASNVNGTSYGADMIFTLGTVGTVPGVTTNAASEINSNNATLNGTVNANNSLTTVRFTYGLTTNYGDTLESDQSPVSGSANTQVSLVISELQPNTVYHYRVVAQNANGTTIGADTSFTTRSMPPTAETNSASAMGSSSATLNGTVNANGASATVTFQYGSDTNYGSTVSADQSPVTGIADTPVSRTITDLINDITYHYRVLATNANGTTYGKDMIFSVGTIAPTAITVAATDISTTSATLNGIINANNGNTAVSFEYGPDTQYGRTVAATPESVTGSSDTAVKTIISNLLANTTYHYRVVGVNVGGSATGADMTFTTGGGPLVTTDAALAIGTSEATLNGIVNAHGENTIVTFEYGLTIMYGTSVVADQSPVTGSANTAVSTRLASLNPGTTYYYRAIGKNANGTTYGTNKIFTTVSADPNAPTAVTNAVSSANATGATLSGTVNANNDSTIVSFEYGLTTAYETTVAADQSPLTGSFNTAVSTVLTGLISDSTYHYRVVAQNRYDITYGSDMVFRTIPITAPKVTTNAATHATANSATLNGMVNANNYYAYTINFEYGLSTSYGTTVAANPNMAIGAANTEVSQSISGLMSNTVYHYRVVVMQSIFGVVYGSDQTFTTALEPMVVTNPASNAGSTSVILNGTVNPLNSSYTVSFEYGPDTDYGRISLADQNPVTGNTDVAVSDSLTDLQPNTLYHFQVVAQNEEVTIYGEDMTFATTGMPPVATTNGADGVTSSRATLHGTVKANNEGANVTFEYGLTTDYGTTHPADQNPVTGNAFTPVSGTIEGLSGNTVYHYRVVAQTPSGTTNGLDETFFTGATIPAVTTQLATDIGSTYATLNSTVIANNSLTTVIFEFGRDTSYGRSINADPNMVSGSTNTGVNAKLTGLSPSTTYHYRVVAVNSVGTTNGMDETFATSTTDDTDGDGITDATEGSGDRDGDGIPDYQDYDPAGYFYDETNGAIISGGQIIVSGPGVITILHNGSSGYYQFRTDDTQGIYTIGVTLPAGYLWSETNLPIPGALDPTGQNNPYVLGNGEDADTGFLTSTDSTQYYLQFDLEAGDPVVINNNIPLKQEVNSTEQVKISVPTEYALTQNYPNPFNPSTTIEFSLAKSGYVELKIYNVLGKEVATLISGTLNQGNHICHFNARNLVSGIYYYQLVAGDYRAVKKMILLR